MMGVANDEDGPRRGVPDQFEHMARHDAWWKRARVRLKWEPIATLPKDLGDLALAEPVILRSANQWAFGHWYLADWIKVSKDAYAGWNTTVLSDGGSDAGRYRGSGAGVAASLQTRSPTES